MDETLILYADDALAVCRKRVGCECEHELPALLAEALHCKVDSLYCVHRLDRAVGGVMVYARTRAAAASLSRAIQEGKFQKEYLAVCAPPPASEEAELRDLLFKDALKQKSYVVSTPRRGVKEAVLRYRVLASAEFPAASAPRSTEPSSLDGVTDDARNTRASTLGVTDDARGVRAALLHVVLETGRFHQIRCQLAAHGHPLLGDGKYGSRVRGCTVALWSHRLTFPHPKTGRRVTYTAAPPEAFPWTLLRP